MLFTSVTYGFFLIITFALYWLLPQRYRWIGLLGVNVWFYAGFGFRSLVLFAAAAVISYICALLLEEVHTPWLRKTLVFAVVATCLGILLRYKYMHFFTTELYNFLNPRLGTNLYPVAVSMVPLGISFYSFSIISYIIDVYRRKYPAERHFGYYAVYLSFFPKITSGPIERADHFLPQLKKEARFSYEQASYGLKRMAWGYFKKLAIASVLGFYVDMVYDSPQNYHGFSLVLAAVFFAIQLYTDFSSYSDIALGTGRLLGLSLEENFNSPFWSGSVKELWNRWHISLNTWFREYVYIPMGGNRGTHFQHYMNLLITFLLSGLWHGANWTYIAWGGLHGIGLVLETALLPKAYVRKTLQDCHTIREQLTMLLRISAVFLFFCFTFIFFRAANIWDGFYVIRHLFDGISQPIDYLYTGFKAIGMNTTELGVSMFGVLLLTLFDYYQLRFDVIAAVSRLNLICRWAIYIALVFVALLIYSLYGISNAGFIYMQF